MKQYASYLRVSTKKQGRSGLGLDAQRKMCNDFISLQGGVSVQEFIDVESGTHRERKGLLDAINYCKKNNCALVIAKLDRLARDVEFCFKVVNTGIEIHFTDMLQMNTLLLGVFASVAQYERELTSDRTKKALAAKKERGEKLGGACNKWRESYNNKSKEERKKEQMEKGKMKRERHHQSRDIQAFAKVIKKTFPYHCEGDDITKWEWMGITCRRVYIEQMLERMAEYKEIDPTLFRNFKFEDGVDANAQKMRSYMQAFKKSFGIVI